MLGDQVICDYLERGVATDHAAMETVLGDLTSTDPATSIVKTDVSFERAMKTYFAGSLHEIDNRCKAVVEKWAQTRRAGVPAPAERALIRRAILKWFTKAEATDLLKAIDTSSQLTQTQIDLMKRLANFYFPGSKRDKSDASSLYGEALRETMDEYDRLRKAFYIKAAVYKQAVAASNPEDTPAGDRDATGAPTRMIPRISDQIRALDSSKSRIELSIRADENSLQDIKDRLATLRANRTADPRQPGVLDILNEIVRLDKSASELEIKLTNDRENATRMTNRLAELKAEQTRLIAQWDRRMKLRQDVVHDPYLIDSVSTKRMRAKDGRYFLIEDTLPEREAFADSLHPIRFSDEYLESVKRESNKRRREDVFRIGVLPGEMLIGIRSPPVFAEDVGLRSGTVARFGAYV